MSMISDAFESVAGTIWGVLESVADQIAGFLKTLWNTLFSWWADTVAWLRDVGGGVKIVYAACAAATRTNTSAQIIHYIESHPAEWNGAIEKAALMESAESSFGKVADFLTMIKSGIQLSLIEQAPLLRLAEYMANARMPVQPYLPALADGLYRERLISEANLYHVYGQAGFDQDKAANIHWLNHQSLPLDMLVLMEQRGMLAGEHRDPAEPLLRRSYPTGEGEIEYDWLTAIRAAGYPDGYSDVLEKLAWPVPGIGDQIRFAVREAFDDAYALKYGTDLERPPDLAKYAAKSGLAPEWANRHWRAHWELPSLTLGFEMLHRRVIDADVLNDLMYALDIMPYWRERLTEVSYQPYTRVDVRRMHAEGILDEDEVYEAYLDHGYDPERAKHMTEFTVRYNTTDEREATKTEVLRWAREMIIDDATAADLLRGLGYPEILVDWHMSYLQAQRQAEVRSRRIKLAERRYKKRAADETDTLYALHAAGLDSGEVNYLMELWEPDRITVAEDVEGATAPEPRQPTLAELRRMVETEVLTYEEWETEMAARRFAAADIDRLAQLHLPEQYAEAHPAEEEG